MKKKAAILAALGFALQPAAKAAKTGRTITCPLPGGESLTFVAPAKTRRAAEDRPRLPLEGRALQLPRR